MDKELMNFVTYLIMSNKCIVNDKFEVLKIEEIQKEIKYYLEEIRGKNIF